MTTPPDSKAPSATPLKQPPSATPPLDADVPPKRPPPRHVPILDADFDDLVPGYSEANAWYEP